MVKQFKKPSERSGLVPDPDKIDIKGFEHQVETGGLRTTEQTNINPEYRKMYTQVRIERATAEQFKELCDEQGIRFYGNYINAVLKAYINGELQNK